MATYNPLRPNMPVALIGRIVWLVSFQIPSQSIRTSSASLLINRTAGGSEKQIEATTTTTTNGKLEMCSCFSGDKADWRIAHSTCKCVGIVAIFTRTEFLERFIPNTFDFLFGFHVHKQNCLLLSFIALLVTVTTSTYLFATIRIWYQSPLPTYSG